MLLLGPAGQLGSEICRRHAQTGAPFELLPLGREALDLAVPGAVERTLRGFDFDVLINCAAWTGVDAAEDRPETVFAVNAHAVQAMARHCAARKARFVHVSSDYVFGGDALRDRPLGEDAPTAPVNVYGRSKEAGERLALQGTENVVILRVASLFGTGGQSGNFVETVLHAARTRGQLRVVDDQTMSPTGAADAARTILRMVDEDAPPGLYHAVNTGAATWFAFARAILRGAGLAAGVVPCASADYPTRAPRPRYTALDNAKVSAAFGAMAPWEDALDRYLHERMRDDT